MTDVRERLAAARLYLCTDGRRRQGDLVSFLDAVLGRRGGHRPAAGEGPGSPRGAGAARGVRCRLPKARRGCSRSTTGPTSRWRRGPTCCTWARTTCRYPWRGGSSGPAPLIGRSSHSTSQATAAATEDGVDYFCAGPVWATPTKPGRSATGLSLISHIALAWRRAALVRDRRDQPVPAGRRAGGRGFAGRGGARDHRGRRPGRGRRGIRVTAPLGKYCHQLRRAVASGSSRRPGPDFGHLPGEKR